MSLQDIMTALEEEAEAQRQEIISRAKKQGEQIIAEAKARFELAEDERRRQLMRAAEIESARLLHQANLSRQSELVSAREAMVEKVMDGAKAELTALSDDPEYATVFKSLTTEAWEAASSLDGDRIIRVNEKDRELAEATLAEMSLKAPVVVDTFAGGGLIVASLNGRQRLVNTLLGRLDRARPYLTPQVIKILFGHD